MIIDCEEKASFMAEAGVETEQESTQANTQLQTPSGDRLQESRQTIPERFAHLIESEDRLQEGQELQSLFRSMPTKIEVDSQWFFLPKKWMDQWEAWCYVDIMNAASDGNLEVLSSVERTEPTRICFSDLFVPKQKTQISDQ